MKAMMIELMIGWPAIAIVKWSMPASTMPPNSAPRTPTMMSQNSPNPWPSARWLARKPATSPTRAHSRMESRFRTTGEPLTEMTITKRPPLQNYKLGHFLKRLGPLAHLRRQLAESRAQHPVEGRVGMDHVGHRADRGA